jgi:hypothetical protein
VNFSNIKCTLLKLALSREEHPLPHKLKKEVCSEIHKQIKQQLQNNDVTEYEIFSQLINPSAVFSVLHHSVFKIIFCSNTLFQIQSIFLPQNVKGRKKFDSCCALGENI